MLLCAQKLPRRPMQSCSPRTLWILTGFATTVDKIIVDAFGTAVTLTTVSGAQTNTVKSVYLLGGQVAGAADTIANSVTA